MKRQSSQKPISPAVTFILCCALATILFHGCDKVHGQEVNITNAVAVAQNGIATPSSLTNLLAGAPNHWTAAVYGTYAPSLSHKLGGGAAVVYGFNDYVGTQVRMQYLNIAKQEGQIWQPNALLTLSAPITFKGITFRPLVDAGVAMDSRCHPYEITGAGAGVSWKNFDLFAGADRWVGPYDSFTAYQAGVAYRFSF